MPLKRTMLLSIWILTAFAACSTPPRNPGEVYQLRRQAETHLEMGNRQADRGDLSAALIVLDEAMRIAIATDDSGLRIRAGLSRGNVLFAQGERQEAERAWDNALAEALRIGNAQLAAVCRIHRARGTLLSPSGAASANDVYDSVSRDMAAIGSDRLYAAFAWTVIALAEKERGRFAQAESAARRSLAIHEKDRYFELAAYDWFMIASFRSLSGDYPGARQALEMAISFDRRVENSGGLASDWRALGDVYRKSGDHAAAADAYTRAAAIFRAINDDAAAEETLARY